MASSSPPSSVRVLFGVLKFTCILCALPMAVVCLMAVTGIVTNNGWARAIVALVVAIGLPLIIIDRMIPSDDPTRARGMPTDILAVSWVAVTLAFVLARPMTGDLLATEGDRLRAAEMNSTADLAYWLGGREVVVQTKAPKKAKPKAKLAKKTKKAPPKKKTPKKVAVAKATKPDAGPARKPDATVAAAKPDAAPAKRSNKTPAEIFRECAPSVVAVRVLSGSTRVGGGTGFVIDDQGTIATNHHVVESGKSVDIKLKDGTIISDVELLTQDKKRDLALLRVSTSKHLEALSLGDSDKVTVGEQVIAIGNPLGLEHTLTDGLVSARRLFKGKKWIQMSAPISPGNSGGPLFNLRGEVIGINTAGLSHWRGAQNLNLAVPINDLKKMIKSDYPKRKRIGRGDSSQSW